MKKNLLRLLVIGLVVFIAIQFIPYGHDHTNPAVVSEPNWDSQATRDLAARACFDCHSNETVWPWYSNVAPVSWLVYHDVSEGRQRFNFSDWNNHPMESGEFAEVINSGEMPPGIYRIQHPNARLTDAEKTQLIQGLQNSTK